MEFCEKLREMRKSRGITQEELAASIFVSRTAVSKWESGRVVAGVAQRAKEKDVPVIAIVGGADGDFSHLYNIGINSVFTINRLPEDFSVSRHKSEENLADTVHNVIRLLKIADTK